MKEVRPCSTESKFEMGRSCRRMVGGCRSRGRRREVSELVVDFAEDQAYTECIDVICEQ